MRVILCIFLCAFLGVSTGSVIRNGIPLDADFLSDIFNLTVSLKDSTIYQATVNDYGQKILENLDKMLVKEGLDPIPLDDIYEGYWWGNIKINKMQISGLATLYRPEEDVIMTYTQDNKQLQLDLPISCRDLKFSGHFKASLLFVGPGGKIEGEVTDLLMRTSLVIDYNFNQAFIRLFEIPHSGHISIHIHSFILTDWMYNLLSDAITSLFHGAILNSVSGEVQELLQNVMDTIDDLLQALLN
ncbi:uncharacterized protein LOC123310222 [Coccinella septempunctata]|uniref:uncharacterized protein LOC123310222 n=1 Tax=Coccinella septempunctata TaxID=41139 RepID=UPI001D08D443|nr:uncharacterized protein LOC123310222 [Coccinella septempunctata]